MDLSLGNLTVMNIQSSTAHAIEPAFPIYFVLWKLKAISMPWMKWIYSAFTTYTYLAYRKPSRNFKSHGITISCQLKAVKHLTSCGSKLSNSNLYWTSERCRPASCPNRDTIWWSSVCPTELLQNMSYTVFPSVISKPAFISNRSWERAVPRSHSDMQPTPKLWLLQLH